MKYLPPGFNTKALEEGVKNKCRWEWLNERDAQGEKWAQWLKKSDVNGIAFCDVCSKSINYKSKAKKAMRLHAKDETHRKNARLNVYICSVSNVILWKTELYVIYM